jgi:hypothetical protein
MKSFAEREIRNALKKAQREQGRYEKTKDVKYLSLRDEYNDLAKTLRENMLVDLQKKKEKNAKKNMTEDQAFKEAEEYNRMIIDEAQNKKRLQMEKEKELKERRMKALFLVKGKQEKMKKNNTPQKKMKKAEKKKLECEMKKETNEQKEAFAKKMKEEKTVLENAKKEKEENGKSFSEEAFIQKAFRKYQIDRSKFNEMEQKTKLFFLLSGVKEEELDERFKGYVEYLKENKEKIDIDYELDDYLEGCMVTDKVNDVEDDIPEPISEEDVETHANL